MKSFVSWSGGKDCMYALYLFLQNNQNNTKNDKNGSKNYENQAVCLLNMCNADTTRSGAHKLTKELLQQQAKSLAIPLIQQPIYNGNYEKSFKNAICELKEQGVDSGIFGDIYLQEHRDWIERVCRETGINPLFPLWKKKPEILMRDIISDGFKAVIVAVKKAKLSESYLGKHLDIALLNNMMNIKGIDVCGENGEYHTFVFDGPLFSQTVSFSEVLRYDDTEHWFLEIE